MMKKKIAIVLLITILLISCGKNPGDQAALNEFEVLDVDENLSLEESLKVASRLVDEKYPLNEPDFKISDYITDEIDLKKSGLKSIAGIITSDDYIVVLDKEDNNIKILNWNGELLRTVGKLGSGNMEFKAPTDFYYEDGKYYILDYENNRVVITDEDFNLIKNLDIGLLKEISKLNAFDSIVKYDDALYLAQTKGREKTMAIISVDMDGNEKLYDQKFGGFLKVVDDKLYAVQNHKGFKYGKEVNSSIGTHDNEYWSQCGDAIYLVADDKMTKLYDLPTRSTFSDLLKIGDSYYMASTSYGFVNEFAIEKGKIEYKRTITRQILSESDRTIVKRFRMQEHDGKIILSDNQEIKIYIIDLTE